MYTFKELTRAAELLLEVGMAIGKTDASGYGFFSVCAFEKKIKVYPTAQKPKTACEIIKLTKLEIQIGPDCKKWGKIHGQLRDLVHEGLLE